MCYLYFYPKSKEFSAQNLLQNGGKFLKSLIFHLDFMFDHISLLQN